MVRSNMYPEYIDYDEFRGIDNGDIDYSTIIYDYKFANQDIEIALGKEKHTYAKYNIVFFSIYLVINDAPISRIGIFEIDNQKLINSMDEDGAIDLCQGKMIIFVDSASITSLIAKHTTPIATVPEVVNDNELTLDVEVLDEEPVDTVMRLNIEQPTTTPKLHVSNKEDKRVHGVFTVNKEILSPSMLAEESEVDSDNIKKEFEETIKNSWIEKFTRNNKYSIIDNEGGGDCFFAVIRDAFQQIGYITTVSDLRKLLASEVNDSLFQEYRTLYMNIWTEYQSIENEMKAVQKKTQVLKKISDSVESRSQENASIIDTRQEQQRILSEANELISQYKKLSKQKKDTKLLLTEFEYMKDIDSIEKFRNFVQTSLYWADTWAVSTLERLLNIKMIILSEEAYHYGDKDSVMQCGQLNEAVNTDHSSTYSPDYYIMTSYTGNHYKLIEYKNKRILKFREIPYDIKTMIVNKCLERNAGPYYLIQEFRNYKSKLGIDPDIGLDKDADDDYLNTSMYDKDTVFMFHCKSHTAPKAGKGSGEHISAEQILNYAALNRIKDWRRKLSDEWIVPIMIEGHRWNSVMHYYLGSQYKKGYPDFYLQFSSDSGSEISKNVDMAIAASSKTGKYNGKLLRPANIKIDSDFYEIGKNNRSEIERYTALNAKFTQNQDMKQILMETLRAKLIHFVRGKSPEPDIILMKLRKILVEYSYNL